MGIALAREGSTSKLRTRRAASSAARPVSPLPALLLTTVIPRALLDQGIDQFVRMPAPPNPPMATVAPSAPSATAARAVS